MTTIETPGLLTFTIAIVVFFIGAGLNRRIAPLRNFNIPQAVTGGLVAALATLAAYALLHVEINFDLEARDLLLLYFFTGIGLNAEARRSHFRRPAAPDPARADAGLSPHPEFDRGRRRRSARPAGGHHRVARLRLADRRPWHDHRLGAAHQRTLRPRERHGDRHRLGDARPRHREPRRRPGRALSHRAPQARRRSATRRRCSVCRTKRRRTTSTMSASCRRSSCSMRRS